MYLLDLNCISIFIGVYTGKGSYALIEIDIVVKGIQHTVQLFTKDGLFSYFNSNLFH